MDSIPVVDSKRPITDYVPIIQADPVSGDCNNVLFNVVQPYEARIGVVR